MLPSCTTAQLVWALNSDPLLKITDPVYRGDTNWWIQNKSICSLDVKLYAHDNHHDVIENDGVGASNFVLCSTGAVNKFAVGLLHKSKG